MQFFILNNYVPVQYFINQFEFLNINRYHNIKGVDYCLPIEF